MDIKDFYPVCINLDERVDRWHESSLEFIIAGLEVNRVSAVRDTNPIVGCAISHFKVLKECESLNKHAMIFEDDVQFTYDVLNLPSYLLALDGMNWDMLYLGANITSRIHRINKYFGRLTSAQSTHAYLVNKNFIPTILSYQGQIGKHMDLIYSEGIVPYHNCYITVPMLAIQRPSFSDIESRFVDYSWMFSRYSSNLERGN